MSKQIEFDYYITPDGLEYSFHHHNAEGIPCVSGRFLSQFSGQGMPPITYVTQRGPFQHGETVLDYRLEPRRIAYVHRRQGCDRDAYWDIRADLINYLRPNRQTSNTFSPGRLRKILPSGAKRDINVFIESGPGYGARDVNMWDETAITETLVFYAPDPVFYDPDTELQSMTIDICSDLVFPFTFPFIFCGSSVNETDTITYTGTWLSYPVITIQGPAAEARVSNITTGEKIEFTRTIPAGTTITINCAYGAKTVTDDTGANWIGGLTEDSDLATFHIAPAPEAPGGVNSISAQARDGVAGETLFTIAYITRYIGI